MGAFTSCGSKRRGKERECSTWNIPGGRACVRVCCKGLNRRKVLLPASRAATNNARACPRGCLGRLGQSLRFQKGFLSSATMLRSVAIPASSGTCRRAAEPVLNSSMPGGSRRLLPRRGALAAVRPLERTRVRVCCEGRNRRNVLVPASCAVHNNARACPRGCVGRLGQSLRFQKGFSLVGTVLRSIAIPASSGTCRRAAEPVLDSSMPIGSRRPFPRRGVLAAVRPRRRTRARVCCEGMSRLSTLGFFLSANFRGKKNRPRKGAECHANQGDRVMSHIIPIPFMPLSVHVIQKDTKRTRWRI